MGDSITLVSTGTANVASVRAALRREGYDVVDAENADDVRDASRLVLPGVGTFAAAAGTLRERGFMEPLRQRVVAGRPTLAICVGLQLLCESSDESPGVEGLACVPGRVQRLPDTVRVPQLGWNRVTAPAGATFLATGYAYFAHSYRLSGAPPGWTVAHTDHGGPFVAAMERGAVLACQFHLELSSDYGRGVLGRWLAATAMSEGATC